MNDADRQLLRNAVTTLICALAYEEARKCGAPAEELERLRGFWVPDAERLVDEADRLGMLDDGLGEMGEADE